MAAPYMHNVAAPGQIPHYTYCYTANPPPPPGMGGLGPAHLANPPLGPRLHHDASGQPYYISAIPLPPRFNSPPEAWGERPPCPDQQSCNQVLFGFSGGPAMNYTIFQTLQGHTVHIPTGPATGPVIPVPSPNLPNQIGVIPVLNFMGGITNYHPMLLVQPQAKIVVLDPNSPQPAVQPTRPIIIDIPSGY